MVSLLDAAITAATICGGVTLLGVGLWLLEAWDQRDQRKRG